MRIKRDVLFMIMLIVVLLGTGCSRGTTENNITSSLTVEEIKAEPKVIKPGNSTNLEIEMGNNSNDYTYQWELVDDEAGKLTSDGRKAEYTACNNQGKYEIKVIISNEYGKKINSKKEIEVTNAGNFTKQQSDLTVNHSTPIIKGETVEFSGKVPENAQKVMILVDEWPLTNSQNKEKLDVVEGKYQLSYSFDKAKSDRDLLIKALDSNGQVIAKVKEKIDIKTDKEAENMLTVNYPEQIVTGKQIEFSGKAPRNAEKVIISVDGWPLTNQDEEKYIKVTNGNYNLNYSFDTVKKDRKLEIKAFDNQGRVLKEKKKSLNVFSKESLTINVPEEIKPNKSFEIKGQALSPIYKVIISIDGYKLKELKTEMGQYSYYVKLNQSGLNRNLVVKAFDVNGKVIKEKNKKIDVISNSRNEAIEGVPYYYQYYNNINAKGSCQNSSIAMVLNYYGWDGKPDTISSSSFGTSAAQTPEGLEKVFNHYARNAGLDVRVRGHRYGSMNDINSLLAEGKPVIVHGYFTGYGHVITLVGYDGTYYYAHDSAGKWDQNYKGDHYNAPIAGKYVKYHKDSMKNAVQTSNGELWYHEIYFVN